MHRGAHGRRRVVAGGAALLLAALTLAVPGTANATEDFEFERIGGSDRYETSAMVADRYGASDQALLVNGQAGNFADALSASYLSGVKNAPVLLTRRDAAPAAVLDQLEALGVRDITVVGGTAMVSQEQLSALGTLGYDVSRLSGPDRFATNAAAIAAGGQAVDGLGMVATGRDFADALAAGPLAYSGHPLALADHDSIDDVVVEALLGAGVTEVLVLGGENRVGPEVVAQLTAAGIQVLDRLAGAGRAETSVEVAEYALTELGFTNTALNVASGDVDGNGADALAGGPLTGKQQRPLLVTTNVEEPSEAVLAFLEEHADTLAEGIIFGSTVSVSGNAADEMTEAARKVSEPEPTPNPQPQPQPQPDPDTDPIPGQNPDPGVPTQPPSPWVTVLESSDTSVALQISDNNAVDGYHLARSARLYESDEARLAALLASLERPESAEFTFEEELIVEDADSEPNTHVVEGLEPDAAYTFAAFAVRDEMGSEPAFLEATTTGTPVLSPVLDTQLLPFGPLEIQDDNSVDGFIVYLADRFYASEEAARIGFQSGDFQLLGNVPEDADDSDNTFGLGTHLQEGGEYTLGVVAVRGTRQSAPTIEQFTAPVIDFPVTQG